MGAVIVELIRYFGWKQAVIVSRLRVGNNVVFCDYASRSVEEKFRDFDLVISDWIKVEGSLSDSEIEKILNRIQLRGRSKFLLQLQLYSSLAQ